MTVETGAGGEMIEADQRGLSSDEAAVRLGRDGPNVLPGRPPTPLWRRVLAQLRDPLIIVLLAAAALTIATGDWTDTAAILLVIVVNTSVGVGQEVRADRAITALSELTVPTARVVRDGIQQTVPAADVVVGDLLVPAEGDIVPADARLVEAAALLLDESSLTGESVPVAKEVGGDESLWAGTVVVKGRGRARVTAVGAASATGRIAGMMGRGGGLTPLQRRLVGIGRMLAGATVVLCAAVLALGLVRGQPVELMVVTAISLVVAAVPESLPAVVTLSLALGARRMAARHALVRRLPAVETLGSVTVLATDKTGTLTEGRMVARRLWTPAGEATITGSGYAPLGEILPAGGPEPPSTPRIVVARATEIPGAEGPGPAGGEAVTALLSAAALCNDARLAPPQASDGEWEALGDPTEAALLAAAAKLGLDREELNARLPRVAEQPFDSERKRMSTAHRLPDGRLRVICKGAPESLLRPSVLADDPGLLAAAAGRADELAGEGFRVLAVARADRERPGDELEQGLHLLGLVAILDPPRTAAAGTIAACRRAGIRPILITGDHPGTAVAVAAELGILDAADGRPECRALDGADLDDEEVGRVGVFARATPQHKLRIVQALRADGQIVAMTGDGVNDGPALRRADIGVAMGRRGTEVARQAADLVLADDALGTVVAAVEEGRRVYANIRRFLIYALSGGAAEIAVMLVGPFLGLALPLLPAQILWINLLTHGLPGVALGGEPARPGDMTRPPRPPGQSILGAGLWLRVIRIAVVVGAVTLGVAVWAHHAGRPWQSMAFFTLGATQLGVALGSRSRLRSRANPMLPAAIAAALALQVAGLYLPALRDLLGTRPLTGPELAVVLALSSLGYAAVRLDRRLHPGRAAGDVAGRVPPSARRRRAEPGPEQDTVRS
ncbi:cation-translocating P-type ATPase [Actinoallomurus rhizosphaericola]|uniref:cation-translocating P-type ATPase n=1 Tax=Actinoallomurus rhizosphaericola TaxID=2952536 RepID=UPI00209305AE|nr:cation-transporting P-type ATPase [Actinoallomurus rhizosphaericola]MCO5995553.1 cation-transporting P-type ATPase [Actinoallomurus rhizosphaericola]